MSKKKKKTKSTEEEGGELYYVIHVHGNMIVKAKNMRFMSGQPTPPNWPPK